MKSQSIQRKKSKQSPEKHHSVYVIELDHAVLKHKKFRDENPGYIEGKACLYVGKTWRTPDERFQQHKDGYKSNSYVRRYGKYLRRRMFAKYNPMTAKEAEEMEVALANKLKLEGYAVWQR